MRIEATVARAGDVIEVRASGSMLDLPREHLMGIVTRLVGHALAEREGVGAPAPDPDIVDVLAAAVATDSPPAQPPAAEPAPAEPAPPAVNLADPDDVRREALRLLDEGALSHEEICARLRIGRMLLQRWDDEAVTASR